MQNSPLTFRKTECSLGTADLERFTEGWLLAGDIARHSPATLALRRLILGKLHWFLRGRSLDTCGTHEIRLFLSYLNHGHEQPGGRWGNPHETRPVKPGTVATYDRHLRAFFSWLVKEELLEGSPMEKIAEPVDRPDQVEPFLDEEVEALLSAAKKSNYAKRDTAIIWFLLDTGVRASELCALRLRDVDLTARRCIIEEGKGGKSRSVWLGGTAGKALWNYLKFEPHDDADPLFLNKLGEAFTRSGLLQLIERLGQAAGIKQTRCSPHTFRHTFAISFLRAGGDVMTLQQLLGHTSLRMVQRYVRLAQTDLQQAHRKFSPADRLRSRRRQS